MQQPKEGLLYGLRSRVPTPLALLLSFQNAALALVFIIYPLILAEASGLGKAETEGLVIASILAIALATLLQSLGKGGVGSGFLAVQISNPMYLPVALMAAKTGGLGLVAGMTIAGGLFSSLLAASLRRLRRVFPPEVCGVAILMLGISMVTPALPRIAGVDALASIGALQPHSIAVAALTLLPMVALGIWGNPSLKLYSAIIGLLFGYLSAILLGIMPHTVLHEALGGGLVALPSLHLPRPSFDWYLLLPFMMAALVSTLDNVACMLTCQKINDPGWVRADMKTISGGALADGLGTLFSGLLGTLGSGTSAAHIAFSSTTGVTARQIGRWTAGMLLLLSFFPPLVRILAAIPEPVMGGVLLYVAAFLVTSGIELVTSRMLDTRRVFMIGFSILAGIAAVELDTLPKGLPPSLALLISSPFALAAFTAIVLNLLFGFGTRQTRTIELEAELASIDRAGRFFEEQGKRAGAPRALVQRCSQATLELLEHLFSEGLPEGPISIESRFDDSSLNVVLSYAGEGIHAGPANLSWRIAGHFADRIHLAGDSSKRRFMLEFQS